MWRQAVAGLVRGAGIFGGKTMPTLNQFVRNECANFKNGACIWGTCEVLSGKRCRVSKAVLLGGDPKTPDDDYFNTCVAPMVKNFPQYTDAAVEYARICGHGVKALKEVRLCECGAPRDRRMRLCAKCRIKNRKNTKRNTRLKRDS